jgi:hypothetical protein
MLPLWSRRAPLLLLAIICGASSPALAQAPTDTVDAILVGRKETAQLRITYSRAVPELIHLRTTLTVLIGGKTIPAGSYQLRTETTSKGAHLAVVEVATEPGGTMGREAVVAQVPLVVVARAPGRSGLEVRIRSQRHAADTVRVVHQSTWKVNRVIKEIVPGTTSTLTIEVGDRSFSASIGAR